MLFITITGIDKSGKTTLIREFSEATSYEHYVVDRSPDTFHFFNSIRDRIKDVHQVSKYRHFQRKFSEFVDLAILLKTDTEELKERFKEHNEPKLAGNLPLEEHQKEIEYFFDSAKYKNVLKLNTSILSIEECVKLIKEKIKCL